MTIIYKKTAIKLCKSFLSQINTQYIANVLKYDDIDLQNKAIEIHQEWVRQVMKIDHTWQYPSNMDTIRHLFLQRS